MRPTGSGVLEWIWRELRDARMARRPVIRVELAPEHWNALRRECDPIAGPVHALELRPTVFGAPVRVVPGKRAPEVIVGIP